MSTNPVYHAILVVDVEGSSGRTDVEKPPLRAALYGALSVAFARAGVRWDDTIREDRGDGTYLLVPASVPKPVLACDLIAAIDQILAEPRAEGGAWPRLRLSLHAGEVTLDREGSSGRDVDLAFALADSDPVRTALRTDRTARCVLVISEPFHAALAQRGGNADQIDDFEQVSIQTKLGSRTAWIRRPRSVRTSGTADRAARGVDPADPPVPWRVLVGLPDGPVCGPGVLVADRHILTCAHLVPGGRSAPRGVAVTFDGDPGGVARRAEVVAFTDTALGVAVLRVPPGGVFGVEPAPVARLGHAAPGRRLLVPGPVPGPAEIVGTDDPTGALIRLRYLGGQADGQADCQGTQAWSRLSPGAPVADADTGAVVGILVERAGWPARNEAVMISMEAAARSWSPLEQRLGHGPATRSDAPRLAAPTAPPGAPAVSVLDFALALAELDALGTGSDRDQVIGLLGLVHPDISGTVRRYSDRRFDVTSLVRTCRQYPKGLDDLLTILQGIAGDSVQMRKIMAMWSEIVP